MLAARGPALFRVIGVIEMTPVVRVGNCDMRYAVPVVARMALVTGWPFPIAV